MADTLREEAAAALRQESAAPNRRGSRAEVEARYSRILALEAVERILRYIGPVKGLDRLIEILAKPQSAERVLTISTAILKDIMRDTNTNHDELSDEHLRIIQMPRHFFQALLYLKELIDSLEGTSGQKRTDIMTEGKELVERIKMYLQIHLEVGEYRYIRYLNALLNTMKGGARKTRKQPKKTVKINGGKTFHLQSPGKNWTYSKKYKKWIQKLTRKSTKKPNTKKEDLCVGENNICEGDLGIPRKYMPQFEDKTAVNRFKKFVRRVYSIKSRLTRRKAADLRPSQKEISRKRIDSLIKDGILEKVQTPLISSNDNYIVDGHHRWAAYKLKKPNKMLPIIEIDAPIKDVLGIAVAWGAKHEEF